MMALQFGRNSPAQSPAERDRSVTESAWRVSDTGVSVSEASGSVSETVESAPEASVCVTAISVSGSKQGVSDPETGFTVRD